MGAWPPRSKHEQGWPVPPRPYREIYAMTPPHFATTDPLIDDDVLAKCRAEFRAHMRGLLTTHITLSTVEAVLTRVMKMGDVADGSLFPRGAYSGFYSCMAREILEMSLDKRVQVYCYEEVIHV